MRPSYIHSTLTSLAAVALFASLPLLAQDFVATASVPTAPIVKSKKQAQHDLKVPRGKQITTTITNGMLSVDGLVTKVQLNYEIHHASRLYFFAPGIGTVILSRANMPGATLVKDAFSETEIAFTADGHTYDLSSEAPPPETGVTGQLAKLEKLAKLKKPQSLDKQDGFIVIDYATANLDRSPMFGYGNTMTAPYTWPLSKVEPKDTYAHYVAPPLPPANMLPRTKASPAPATVAAGPGGAATTTVTTDN